MKVKVKLNGGFMPYIHKDGDLFDVYSAEDVEMKGPQAGTQYTTEDGVKFRDVKFDKKVISLGLAMEMPKGFKAVLVPRSSTLKKFGIIFGNSIGEIDNSYNGDDDIWGVSAVALEHTIIEKGDRIAQFEIVPSCKATRWQKLRWLLSNKIKFVEVKKLGNKNRKGWGHSGRR